MNFNKIGNMPEWLFYNIYDNFLILKGTPTELDENHLII
jgi:hypothetical protein